MPVEADGSAYFELPALRSFFFVALDENDLSVKRMQSFLTVQPGETPSCVGCHEHALRRPKRRFRGRAWRAPASRLEPIAGVPDVSIFRATSSRSSIALCVNCHGYDKPPVGPGRALILTGDRGPMFSHSYYMLTVARPVLRWPQPGPQQLRPARSAPRPASSWLSSTARTTASRPSRSAQTAQLWIESGAAYPGTYAALGTGMIGGYAQNSQVETDSTGPTTHGRRQVLPALRRLPQRPAVPAARIVSTNAASHFWQPQDRRSPPSHQPPHCLQLDAAKNR